MTTPDLTIEPLDLEDASVGAASLGGPRIDAMVSRLVNATLAGNPEARAYALAWEGTRTPRGAEIEGREIGWMRHGALLDENGSTIGYYERTLDCAGPGGKGQGAVVVMTCPPPEPGPSPCP